MADITITPVGSLPDGAEATKQTGVLAADDYYIPNNGQVRVMVDSSALVSPIDMTIETFREVDGLALPDRVVAVPATDDVVHWYGPFTPGTHNDSEGRLHVTFSADAPGVVIAATQ